MIIGIDPQISREQQGDNWKIVQGDGVSIQFTDCSRVLKPYGKPYVSLGPIWTSIRGHHYRIVDMKWAELIPTWGHLLVN